MSIEKTSKLPDPRASKTVHLHPDVMLALEQKESKSYGFRTQHPERQPLKLETGLLRNQVSSFHTVDTDLLSFPTIDFENRPNNWTTLTRGLSILSGFVPKNVVLLRKLVQTSSNEAHSAMPEDSLSPLTSSKRRKPTLDELREKRRREMAHSFENYVEGRNERQELKDAREKRRRMQILLANMENRARIRKEEFLKHQALLSQKNKENDFLPYWNFKIELSFHEEALESDPFEIFSISELFVEDFFKSGISERTVERDSTKERPMKTSEKLKYIDFNGSEACTPSKSQLLRTDFEFFGKRRTNKRCRRKSDASSYCGGISPFEQKTMNLVLESVREPFVHEGRASESSLPRNKVPDRPSKDLQSLKLLNRRKTQLVERNSIFMLKQKPNHLKSSIMNSPLNAHKQKLAANQSKLNKWAVISASNNERTPRANKSISESLDSDLEDKTIETSQVNSNARLGTLLTIRNDSTPPNTFYLNKTPKDKPQLLVNKAQININGPTESFSESLNRHSARFITPMEETVFENNGNVLKKSNLLLPNNSEIKEIDSFVSSPIAKDSEYQLKMPISHNTDPMIPAFPTIKAKSTPLNKVAKSYSINSYNSRKNTISVTSNPLGTPKNQPEISLGKKFSYPDIRTNSLKPAADDETHKKILLANITLASPRSDIRPSNSKLGAPYGNNKASKTKSFSNTILMIYSNRTSPRNAGKANNTQPAKPQKNQQKNTSVANNSPQLTSLQSSIDSKKVTEGLGHASPKDERMKQHLKSVKAAYNISPRNSKPKYVHQKTSYD